MFSFKKFRSRKEKPAADHAPPPADADADSAARSAAATVQDAPVPPSTPSPLAAMNAHWLQRIDQTPATGALNSQIVQAAQLSNAETAGQAPAQIAIAPDMMITQSSGLVAQSGATYFDGVSKVALASKAVLLQQMTENIAQEKLKQAMEDALGALIADLLVGTAAAVAAAAGALEAEAASFAIDKVNHSIGTYHALMNGKSDNPVTA